MNWKPLWNDWKWIVAGVGACAGAFLLNARAWQVGYGANALALLGCHFLRLVLLLFAWVIVVTVFRAALRKEKPTAAGGVTILEAASALTIFLGCMGCYPVWPVVLLLTAPMFLGLVFFGKCPAEHKLSRLAVVRVGIAVGLFLLTWYLCATTTRQALRGLGERIEAKGGSEKLTAWATEVIAAHKQRERNLPIVGAAAVGLMASPQGQGPFVAASALIAGSMGNRSGRLEPDEIPDWVDDLLGPFQGVRSVGVEDHGGEPCVALFTGGSAFHFRITVCPLHVRDDAPPWWLGELAHFESHQGIYLETEGK
jgi:hypothetical protein